MRFVDIESLSQAGAFSHHPNLLDGLPDVTVAAVSGLAPQHLPHGRPVYDLFLHRVGMGSLLTYGNRHSKSCLEYGQTAIGSGEDWEANTFSLTLLVLRLSESSKFSFAADGRFHCSWQEQRMEHVPLCLLIDGSWKAWKKYARFATDSSFSKEHRVLLEKIGETMIWLETTHVE